MRLVVVACLAVAMAACGGSEPSAPGSVLVPSPPSPKYRLSGTVRDETGQPVPSARVYIGFIYSKTPTGFTTDTDTNGHYEGTIGASTWDFTVTKNGYESQSGKVTVSSDTVFDITFPLRVYFGGRITELGVGLLDGVNVEIVAGPNKGLSDVTGTPVTGVYGFSHLIPGELVFRASKAGYDSVERTLMVNASTNFDFTMRWAYGTCLTSVAPVSFDLYKSAGGTQSVSVGAASGRTWTATPDSPWIELLPPASRTGSGPLAFRVQQYAPGATEPRKGAVQIRCSANEGQNIWITQLPNCQIALTPIRGTPSVFSVAGGSGFLQLTTGIPGCYWDYRSQTDWITTAGIAHWHGDLESISFIVKPNPTGRERIGSVVVNDTEWQVIQQP